MAKQAPTEHKLRRMVLNYIQKHPGASYSDIKRTFELSDGTLRYHLSSLERAKLIGSALREGRRCYHSLAEERDPGGRGGAQRKVLETIKRNPGISAPELGRSCRLNKKNLGYHLDMLMSSGSIIKIMEGGTAGYWIVTGELLRRRMLKRLVLKFLDHEIDEDTFFMIKDELER